MDPTTDNTTLAPSPGQPGLNTTGATPRMQALQQLSNNIPVANSRVAAGQQAARDLQLQQAAAAAPVGSAIGGAQAMGAQQAQQQGQQALQNAQTGLQQQGQIGALGIEQQQQNVQQQVESAQLGAQKQATDNVARLAAVSEQAKSQLYDKQMQLQTDQNGLVQLNSIQMADYATMSAQNQQQYQNYAQSAQQMNQKNLLAIQTSYQKVMQDLQNKYDLAKQSNDEATAKKIKQQMYDAGVTMQQTENDAANTASAWQVGGGLILGTAGAIAGGPGGAKMGYGVGSAAGQYLNASNVKIG